MVAASPSFDSVWAKVERAKEHRDTLQSYIAETFSAEEKRPRLGLKFDPEARKNILYVNRMPDLADDFERCSLLLGDAVHNLRTALDHLTYQLALLKGPIRRERELEFPITESLSDWKSARKRNLAQLRAADRDVIERYQGYHRLDAQLSVGLYFHPLVMLGELDNADKHRLLNTVMVPDSGFESTTGFGNLLAMFQTLDITQEFIEAPAAASARFEANPVELGTVVAATSFMDPLQSEVENAGYVAPVIALSEGRPAVAVIDKIAAVVVKVIREFDPLP